MSETMSSPGDWMQFYQHNLSPPNRTASAADATVVTTTVTSATAPSPHASATHLNPDGRVSKPIRRRSRASRRTPTTLLNTDTTNFRAMVQQFTGGPSAPFASAGSANLAFGLGSRQQQVNHPSAVMVPPGYHLQFQQQQYQQQQQQYMYPLSNVPADAFLQRLTSNSRPANMEVSNELVGEGFSSQAPSSSNGNRANNFIF